MCRTHRIAAHGLQHRETEALQTIGQRGADTGMILVIACSLDLQRFAVQKESFVRIEDRSANPETDSFCIARAAVNFNRRDGAVEIRIVDRPKLWVAHPDTCAVIRKNLPRE